jgi:hypothetical protein
MTAAGDSICAEPRTRPWPTTSRSAVLTELLPLDERRVAETLAFDAGAATTPELAQTQRTTLAETHNAVTEAFANAWGDRVSAPPGCWRRTPQSPRPTRSTRTRISSAGWLSGNGHGPGG